jgi:hypothetical protein
MVYLVFSSQLHPISSSICNAQDISYLLIITEEEVGKPAKSANLHTSSIVQATKLACINVFHDLPNKHVKILT